MLVVSYIAAALLALANRSDTPHDAPAASPLTVTFYSAPFFFLPHVGGLPLHKTSRASSLSSGRLAPMQRPAQRCDPLLGVGVSVAVDVVCPIRRGQGEAAGGGRVAGPLQRHVAAVARVDVAVGENDTAGRVGARLIAAVLVGLAGLVVQQLSIGAQHKPSPLPVLHPGA